MLECCCWWRYTCEFVCPESPEERVRSHGAGDVGVSISVWVLGTELRPSAKAMCAHSH